MKTQCKENSIDIKNVILNGRHFDIVKLFLIDRSVKLFPINTYLIDSFMNSRKLYKLKNITPSSSLIIYNQPRFNPQSYNFYWSL